MGVRVDGKVWDRYGGAQDFSSGRLAFTSSPEALTHRGVLRGLRFIASLGSSGFSVSDAESEKIMSTIKEAPYYRRALDGMAIIRRYDKEISAMRAAGASSGMLIARRCSREL